MLQDEAIAEAGACLQSVWSSLRLDFDEMVLTFKWSATLKKGVIMSKVIDEDDENATPTQAMQPH